MEGIKAEIVGAPMQQSMDGSIEACFGRHEGLLVKQTMRGCLQECIGCEAKSEFKVAPFDWSQLAGDTVTEQALAVPDEMYALEESTCCCRLCWRDGRPFEMKVSTGGDPGGTGIVHYKKPCGCPLNFEIESDKGKCSFPCCCMLPMVETVTPQGQPIGNDSKYICDINLLVPKLQFSEGGKPVYIVKPETCCGGCCISFDLCSGKGCTYVPFYFHDPVTMEVVGSKGYDNSAPQIRKVWAGLKKECCSTADTFVIKFPDGCDANRKAGLLGMTFLIDFTVFERQQDNNTIAS